MKHKYQSSLSRRLVASGLAAVFSAGAFSSYVGAMNENANEQSLIISEVSTKVQNKEEIKAPTDIAKVTIDDKIYEFKNIPSDQISSDFNKYVKGDPKAAVDILTDLDKLFSKTNFNLKDYTLQYFFEFSNIHIEKFSVSFSTLYERGYFDNFIHEFPKPVDILYFIAKDSLKLENSSYLNNSFFSYLISNNVGLLAEVLRKHFKFLYRKIAFVAEKYFNNKGLLYKRLADDKYWNLCAFLFVAVLLDVGAIAFVYNGNKTKYSSNP